MKNFKFCGWFAFIFTLEFILFLPSHVVGVENQKERMLIESIVNEHVVPFFKEKQLAGLAVAVYYNQQGYIYSYGMADRENSIPITPDTVFRIGSITKIFTALDLALQVNKGKMSLNDSIAKYLPALRGGGPIQNVTLLELATHSSSLPRYAPFPKKKLTLEKVMGYLQTWQPSFPIGSQYNYSNLAFGVLGIALANLEGKSYQSVIETNICAPLNMTSTGIKLPPHLKKNIAVGYSSSGHRIDFVRKGVLPGSGSLRSTPTDLLKFLEANLGVAVPYGLFEAMQLTQRSFFKPRESLAIGLAWQLITPKGVLIIDKNGGVPGFSSYIGMLPQKKIGIVILQNKKQKGPTELGRKILLKLNGNGNSL